MAGKEIKAGKVERIINSKDQGKTVRIPMILMFKYITNAGKIGIWFFMSFSNLLISLYGYWLYRRNKWQRRIIE